MNNDKKTILIKKKYKIPNSYIQEDCGNLEIVIKIFKIEEGRLVIETNKNKIKAISKRLFDIIEKYLKESGINANISGIYNKIFEETDYHITFKAKRKNILVNNNIHFQIIV